MYFEFGQQKSQAKGGKMKKAMILVSIGIFLFSIVLPVLSYAAGKGFYLGMNFGGMPIAGTFNGYGVGGEIGFQFSERVAIMGEVEYGYQSYSHESSGEYYSYHDEMNLSTVPISGSLVFITPIGEKFSARIGAGLGYYSIKIKQTSRESNAYYGSESEVETQISAEAIYRGSSASGTQPTNLTLSETPRDSANFFNSAS